MSSELMVRDESAVDLAGLSLEQLAQAANDQHQAVAGAASQLLKHAIWAGQALIEAKARVPLGEWEGWAAENIQFSPSAMAVYMRLATYRDEVLAGGYAGINAAMTALRGKPRADNGKVMRKPDWMRDEVQRLHEAGLTNKAISELVDVSEITIGRWLNPDVRARAAASAKKRNERLRLARIALQQKERDRVVKQHGGAVAEAYALIRRAAQQLDRAQDEEINREIAGQIRSALGKVHAAEDEIVRTLKGPSRSKQWLGERS